MKALSVCPSAMRYVSRPAARVRIPAIGKTPVSRAAACSASTSPTMSRACSRLAEYSTMRCGMGRRSVHWFRDHGSSEPPERHNEPPPALDKLDEGSPGGGRLGSALDLNHCLLCL